MTAKVIMIQGTMSNVGKSFLTAGLCRVFRQDGYRVAPFKSQNMALNSYVTADGLEMGRAQVMQAEAAGILPDVRMNPVLLKPASDTGSQVIVRGEVLGSMDARRYFAFKRSLMPVILESYRSLAEENDILVIEGAGSPAEINLKRDDIVNMGLAKAVGAPVLLTGDIDLGGVFAQLLGTQMLLDPEEQDLLKGLIINKFRGDRSILEPGIRILEERSGLPVVGVVPYMNLDLDEEDSLSARLTMTNRPPLGKAVEIAVIRLPHLSNYTDFNVFEEIPDVDLRYVNRPSAIGTPDMILLPGTKNTMDDLQWLRHSGMEEAIRTAMGTGSGGSAGNRPILFGICGGFQMLCKELRDPDGTESGRQNGVLDGLGFLDAVTVFENRKRRTQVRGRVGSIPGALSSLSGSAIEGYEIHMGRTEASEKDCAFSEISDLRTGIVSGDGIASERVYGTYVHGIFDAPGIALKTAQTLAERKGLTVSSAGVSQEDRRAFKEKQYDMLADQVREHIDMEKVYEILEAGVCCTAGKSGA